MADSELVLAASLEYTYPTLTSGRSHERPNSGKGSDAETEPPRESAEYTPCGAVSASEYSGETVRIRFSAEAGCGAAAMRRNKHRNPLIATPPRRQPIERKPDWIETAIDPLLPQRTLQKSRSPDFVLVAE
jgi:hypothetical protein